MKYCILDIETSLDHKVIRLVNIYIPDSDIHLLAINPADLKSALSTVNPEEFIIVYHNGTRFDAERLLTLWEVNLSDYQTYDTLMMSKMLFPDRASGHSLDAWGKYLVSKGKLKEGKKPPDDLSWYDTASNSELREYCEQDCMVTWELFKFLEDSKKKLGGKWDHPLKVEQAVGEITNRQVKRKVLFDTDKARDLVELLDREMEIIEDEVHPYLPECHLPASKLHYPPKVQFKANGDPSAHIIKYCDKYGWKIEKSSLGVWYAYNDATREAQNLPISSPLCPVTKQIELSNQKELKEWLLEQGWKPTMWNVKKVVGPKGGFTKTSPRLTDRVTKEPCPNLAKVGFPHAGDIARWLMLRSRRNLLLSPNGTGLIPKAEADGGYIASDADTVGTPTARYRHKGIVNIPRVTSAYGRSFRELFRTAGGFKMVGWDATSLEACMEGHYTFPYDGGAYARELTTGDVHTKNLKALGLRDRDQAKTFKYAVTYGAQPPKIAEQMGVHKSVATGWFEDFWAANEPLAKFKKELEYEWEHYNRKYIIGLDGRLIGTRSKHSLLNSKFQSAGAIVMKHAFILADKMIMEKFGLAAAGLIRYHDEEQWEALPVIADEVGSLGVKSLELAGKYLKLNVPITGEYKVGKTWADTH